MIVTVLPLPAPLVIEATPLPLTTTPPASDTATTVPAPSDGSGCVAGNEVSLAIATKPPKAFVTVRILSLTAFEVGIAVSLFVVRVVSPTVLLCSWFYRP